MEHKTKGIEEDIREVGLVHSSEEVSNDHRTKGLAYNRFFRETLTNPKRRKNKWKVNEKI